MFFRLVSVCDFCTSIQDFRREVNFCSRVSEVLLLRERWLDLCPWESAVLETFGLCEVCEVACFLLLLWWEWWRWDEVASFGTLVMLCCAGGGDKTIVGRVVDVWDSTRREWAAATNPSASCVCWEKQTIRNRLR